MKDSENHKSTLRVRLKAEFDSPSSELKDYVRQAIRGTLEDRSRTTEYDFSPAEWRLRRWQAWRIERHMSPATRRRIEEMQSATFNLL